MPEFPQCSLEQIQTRKGKFLACPRVYKRRNKYARKRWGRHSADVHCFGSWLLWVGRQAGKGVRCNRGEELQQRALPQLVAKAGSSPSQRSCCGLGLWVAVEAARGVHSPTTVSAQLTPRSQRKEFASLPQKHSSGCKSKCMGKM